MKDFKNKVAVITGAGSGIGAGFARRCAVENMRIVLADINPQHLERIKAELLSLTTPNRILALPVDAGSQKDLEQLAQKTLDTFGQVDLLFNHAGMPGPLGPIWTASHNDIDRVVQVNLTGMMHSLRIFVPIMLAQNTPGHIVNTSSGAGLKPNVNMACYITTKRAVIALSEALSLDLAAAQSKIHASVLCPGMVATHFADMLTDTQPSDSTSVKALKTYFEENLPKGIPVEQVVDQTFDAIQQEKFYILTHLDEHASAIKSMADNMLSGRNPVPL